MTKETKKDNLIDCPLCSEKGACYSIAMNEFHNAYTCLGCGYQSNDLAREGEMDFESFEAELPELYKDMKKTDSEDRIWYPSVVNVESMGTVFMNGSSTENARWSAIKSIKLTKAEKKKPVFKGKTHKSDPKTMKDFGTDYLSALEYIGVI